MLLMYDQTSLMLSKETWISALDDAVQEQDAHPMTKEHHLIVNRGISFIS
jgi:hypothetical protein